MSRKEQITLAVLTDAWTRRLTRRQVADELGIKINTVTAACIRLNVYLPKTTAPRSGSKLYAIIATLLSMRGTSIVCQRVADQHGVSRAYVSKIMRSLEREGVKF